MGNRPQDHRDRDLLLGSLLRDHRTRLSRHYSHDLPDWAPTLPKGWPCEFRLQGQQLIVLGSMQERLLDRLRNSIALADDEEQAVKMLDAMEDCMPIGALFERRDTNDSGRHCGYSKLCPWCHARSVENLYRRLVEGRCAAANLAGKTLILARMDLRDVVCQGGSVLDRSQVLYERNRYRETARSIADELGIDGGIVFYQFGPIRTYGPRARIIAETFAPTITMIGESRSLTDSDLEEIAEFAPYWLALPADAPQSLRYLLFGTSYKFPMKRIAGLKASGKWFTKHGIPGAASLQPWFLFNETQAWSYLAATAGTRLYDTFGTWRKNGRAVVKAVTEDREGERVSREQAFRNENNDRRYDAGNRRAGLMPKAEMVFRKLKSEMGRNPGSTALRAALAVAGHAISDRDSRWLVKQMPLCYEGEPRLAWPVGAGLPKLNIDN